MLSRLALAAACLSFALSLPVQAGEVRQGVNAVLELFTSQGCSSCPKADAVLSELSRRPGVVALAYHVDYWDYIGWQDTFGTKLNSDRQRDYAQSWGSSKIFTPQLVVNGRGSVVGSREKDVNAATQAGVLPISVSLRPKGDMLEVTSPPNAAQSEAVVWLVTFIARDEVEIERGENQGKKIAYSHIVTGRQVLGMWEPETGLKLKLPLGEVLTGRSDGAAILVQAEKDGLPGPILGAASFTR